MEKFNNFYFHSVRFNLKTLEKILRDGAILSREMAKLELDYDGYNGNKWISICKYYQEEYDCVDYSLDSAYQTLVIDGISLVIDGDINAIKTRYMPYDALYYPGFSDDSDVRYSCCIDEYQVKNRISREHFKAILYPIEKLGMDVNQLKFIRDLLCKYRYNIPIIDSSSAVIERNLDKLEKKILSKV